MIYNLITKNSPGPDSITSELHQTLNNNNNTNSPWALPKNVMGEYSQMPFMRLILLIPEPDKHIIKKEIIVSGFKNYLKVTVMKAKSYWHKCRDVSQWNKLGSLEIYLLVYGQIMLSNGVKTI